MTPFEQLLSAADRVLLVFGGDDDWDDVDYDQGWTALRVAVARAQAVQLREVDIDTVHRRQGNEVSA